MCFRSRAAKRRRCCSERRKGCAPCRERGLRIAINGLLQYRGECGAGVFNVGVDAAGNQRLMADVTAGEIEAALDLQMCFRFDLLREQLAEDDLLSEILCADDGVFGRGAANNQ